MAIRMCEKSIRMLSKIKLLSPNVALSSIKLMGNISYLHNSPESVEDRDSWVVLTDRGDTVVCWHPEPEFPYEFSKPLPMANPEIREGDSALKVQYRLEHLYRYRPDGPTMEELMSMTYTNKHIWYPNSKDRYKTVPPIDREGI